MQNQILDSIQEWCFNNKVKVTCPNDPDYPRSLLSLPYRPQFLFYRGHACWNTSSIISVVGSREASQYSLDWMDREVSDFLDITKATIISGGARGIDQKAHQLSLRKSLPTLALIPSGLAQVYPKEFSNWTSMIESNGGAIMSQFFPHQAMNKGFFQIRNRLIAAMSGLTLVIEARRGSGTLITARYANELGRAVATVPTFPTHKGLGGLDLIIDGGAHPLRDSADLLALYNSTKLVN